MTPRFSPNYGMAELFAALMPSSSNERTLLEEEFAVYTEQSDAISFRYGRSGLYFLLQALGAKNRKVIMPAYTCVVVANAVVRSGNIPVFLDSAPNRFQPSTEDYLRAIDDQTALIMPTHLFGMAEETKSLVESVRLHHPHVFVLQDCAHSMVCHDSTGAAVTKFGDGALFGLNISKLVNSVKGGMLTLQSSELAEEVRRLAQSEPGTNFTSSFSQRTYVAAATAAFTPIGYELVSFLQRNTNLLAAHTDYYDPASIDLPHDYALPLDSFSAKIGRMSLRKLDERIYIRRETAKFYHEELVKRGAQVELQPWSDGFTWSHFPVLVQASLRDSIRAEMTSSLRAECGVIVDYSIPDLSAYKANSHPACPRASSLVRRVLNLPLTFREGMLKTRDWRKSATAVVELITRLTNESRGEAY